MPPVTTSMQCPFCKKDWSRKTVSRHTRVGCDAAQREALRQDSALQRLVNPDYNLAPRRPRERRTYHRRDPPPDPPPTRNRPSQGASRQPDPPPLSVPPEQPQQPGQTGDPVRDEYEALLHAFHRHPDFHFDTPGAGPSHFGNPIDRRPIAFPSTSTAAPHLSGPDRRVQEEAQPWLAGLSTEDKIRMGLDEEIVTHGGRKLKGADLLAIRGFNFKVNTGITSRAFGKLPQAFPELDSLPTEARIRTRIQELADIESRPIEICEDSCVAFTGGYEKLRQCPRCSKNRYKPDPDRPGAEQPVKTFSYIPLIPRLVNLYRNRKMAKEMQYRARFIVSPDGVIKDIFNGAHYQRWSGGVAMPMYI